MLNINDDILRKKSTKYTESCRNTDTLFKYMPYIEDYYFKSQKLPLPLHALTKLEEFAKNSHTDFAEKFFI